MKNLFLFIFLLIGLDLYSQYEQSDEIRSNQNVLKFNGATIIKDKDPVERQKRRYTINLSSSLSFNNGLTQLGNIIGLNNYNVGTIGQIPTKNGSGGLTWITPTVQSNDWTILGNSGTNSNVNFIGTIDNQNLIFKRFNDKSGLIAINNTSFGRLALPVVTSGSQNVGFGNNTLEFLTTQFGNTAIGSQSLQGILGNNNTAIGTASGAFSTSGNNNTLIGANTNLNILTGSNQLNLANIIFGSALTGSVGAPQGNIGIRNANPTSTFDINGSISSNATVITTTYIVLSTDNFILVNNLATAITITLPDPTICLGRKIVITRHSSSTGIITITNTGTASIQALAGTLGATTTLALLGANENWNATYKSVSVGGVSSWYRIN